MLRYAYCKELFAEIPKEISLGVSISGCQIRCIGCHSKDLWKDSGTVLGLTELQWLLNRHFGITCLLLLGGERDIDTLTDLLKYAHTYVKTAWYCGLDSIPDDKKGILEYLDYIKIGHYDALLGGLTSPKTNQRFYEYDLEWEGSIEGLGKHWRDTTSQFQLSKV